MTNHASPLEQQLKELRFEQRLDQIHLVADHADPLERTKIAVSLIQELKMQRVFEQFNNSQHADLLDTLEALVEDLPEGGPQAFGTGAQTNLADSNPEETPSELTKTGTLPSPTTGEDRHFTKGLNCTAKEASFSAAIWEKWALEDKVPMPLAELGRKVIKQSHESGWSPELQHECGWSDSGAAMLELARTDPEKAKLRWHYLIDSNGELYT